MTRQELDTIQRVSHLYRVAFKRDCQIYLFSLLLSLPFSLSPKFLSQFFSFTEFWVIFFSPACCFFPVDSIQSSIFFGNHSSVFSFCLSFNLCLLFLSDNVPDFSSWVKDNWWNCCKVEKES